MNVDFHSRHSLSAGGRGASSAYACGVSLPRFSRRSLVPSVPITGTFLKEKNEGKRVVYILKGV
ncbi:hypothetical protein COF64_24300 [Bacillus sp. AFS043905]|nr:hypothetical protein COF64_24300 [Bacillus sp. AFS043905]